MRIRTKLTLLLLVVSIVPLFLAAGIGQLSTRRIGFGLADDAREALLTQRRNLLLQLARDDAELFRRDAETLAAAVQFQAREVSRALASAPPEPSRPVRFSDDYELGEDVPADYGAHPGYERRLGGGLEPLPVSFEDTVFHLAPGVPRRDVAGEVRRLSDVGDIYRLVRSVGVEAIRWQYTSLESGLHCAYPGHGGYPEGFDPRERPWYSATMSDAGPVVWNNPLTDATTGMVMVTVSAPVTGPDGWRVGVTAIDLGIGELLAPAEIAESWGANGRVYLVETDPGEGDASGGLAVIAERGYEEAEPRWDRVVERRSILGGDPEGARRLAEDLRRSGSGLIRMTHEGEDALWAYAALWPDSAPEFNAGLVLIVPYRDIVREAEQAEQRADLAVYVQLGTNAAALLTVVAIVVAIAILVSRHVTRPIRELAEAATRVAGGDLDARVEIRTHDELHELGETFNSMVPQLADRLRMRESLDLAVEVQQNLLPDDAPQVGAIDIAGVSTYCDETGGDYYDFIELAGGRLGVAVGDVTGHGVAAALLMTTARALLRARIDQPGTLAEQVRDVNTRLSGDSVEGRFMTLFMLEIGDDRLRWISAGHDPAIVYDPSKDGFSELAGADIPLGIDPDWSFRERERPALGAGEILLIGTDGIWESRDHAGEMFGKDRLRGVIRGHAGRSAAEICGAVREAAGAFRGLESQQDDLTLVVLKGRA